MAGESLIKKRQRDIAVCPRKQNVGEILALVDVGFGGLDDDAEDEPEQMADAGHEWEKLADKHEDFEGNVEEYLNDGQGLGSRKPPIVAAPPKITKEKWERHHATHTHFTCLVASVVQQLEQ